MTTDDLLARHRAVLPSWLPLYYDEPIELVAGSGPPGHRRRGPQLPRLLRRRADQHDRLRHPGDPRGGRAAAAHRHRAHLDALPDPPAGRAGREDRRGSSGIPDARVFFTNSGTEANEAALLLATNYRRSQPDPRGAQQLPRPHVRDDGRHRQPRLVGLALNPLNVSYLHSGDRLRGLLAGLQRRRVHRRAPWPTCARCSPRRPPATWPR